MRDFEFGLSIFGLSGRHLYLCMETRASWYILSPSGGIWHKTLEQPVYPGSADETRALISVEAECMSKQPIPAIVLNSIFFIGFCCSRPLQYPPMVSIPNRKKNNLAQATLKRCCNQRCQHQVPLHGLKCQIHKACVFQNKCQINSKKKKKDNVLSFPTNKH